ncbi:hypothetical protein PVAND_012250 [Polypedilum vanderplanki]|uniref:AAA+ ATPase domain-containing protein n=1 Tax=Polypedilum vanderplanki TaxID=319348 RepID=A0A9J6CLV0_POLVA|nr:hypothetical protein PVAND_012250 [Polypedilum vanderplanki]
MLPNDNLKKKNKRISSSTSCRHLDVNDYDRIIHGFPPILRKTKPLEKIFKEDSFVSLPSISNRASSAQIQSRRASEKGNSYRNIDELNISSFIENRVRNLKQNAFLYLTYAYRQSSEFFTPYSFIEVPYSKIDKSGFFTISKEGFTFWSPNENHFTRLEDWYGDYLKYCDVIKIKLFKKYRIWKSFTVWQKAIKWKKFYDAKNYIEENLFFANPILHETLLELRKHYCQLIDKKFTDIELLENWQLFYFLENQMTQFEMTRDMLEDFHTEMEIKLFDACYRAIKEKGFSPEDEILNCKSVKKLKEQISFTDRANKRLFCSRLTNFLCLTDLITIELLSTILCTSFDDLARVFQIHSKYGPTFQKLKSSNSIDDVVLEDPRPENVPQSPFLIADLVLKPDKIEVDPSKDVCLYVIGQMFDLFYEAVHNFTAFQGGAKFRLFTEPSIVGHQEDRLYNVVQSIDFILEHNAGLTNNKKSIINIINIAYDKIEIYIKRFDHIKEQYKQDLAMNKEHLNNEKDLDQLIDYCDRFTREMESLDGILPEINLGLILLRQGTFKEKIIPRCKELLSILEEHLPKLAKETIIEVREKAENLMTKLITVPQEAQSYVNYLFFLEKCPHRIDEIEKVLKYAMRAFQIMKDFAIMVDDDEKDQFLDTEEYLHNVKVELELRIVSRQDIINQLERSLQNDIENIFKEISAVHVDVMKPELIDENANSSQVRETLSELMEKLHECQEDSQKIRGWQKTFRIDVTRFDSLDTVFQEVRLRQTLWDNLQSWKDCYEELIEIPFHKLNMQQVVELNTKILKNCGMLEKNLPRNEIVPRLKADCEEFKEKIPILQCLRSTDLKPRHWLKIEQTLDRKLLGNDNITLYTFEDANAFEGENAASIQEITAQATGEAKLEEALKKVDTVWKQLELSVVSRDSRDVFILAGIDELQSVLDDSNVTIATIAASKHIGTLKPRIDEWIRQLDIFGKTFDEWINVQQSWIYLEAIFSAPDIQRQLPQEANIFNVVDRSWKEIMRNVAKYPLALPAMTQNGYYEILHRNNTLLEQVQRCLEAYLELKRVAFPRFYFLSNEELLEILAQTKNPHAVQPHLQKCFDAIARIEFAVKDGDKKGEKVITNDILSMISPENEKVQFGRGLKARGSVEDWLSKVEEAMFSAVKRCMKHALQNYSNMSRLKWLSENANQVVLTVSQQQWAMQVHQILDFEGEDTKKNLIIFDKQLTQNLTNLASIARTDISPLLRKVLCALITVDVHAKDSVNSLIENNVTNSNDFNWLKMLRYYWNIDTEQMEVKMASAHMRYFYEYIGASGVLVITPLTDRCYLCLMGALQMELSGAPQGPAGTGKTETTKDLAKAVAKQCVVFNCSDGLDYKMMGRFFSGLAQSGAWCCFDEFNRIDIEVLSVIAQQLITIKNAKVMNLTRFIFEGREIKIERSCAAFITMNPGYAGRTELPDNLKALFRPISMMIPNYQLIAEVILYSEGFENSKVLAQKMIQTYKLCSEQLSQQSHYDFGMRAVKSVLVMAGSLKRAAPNQAEEMTLICALRDSNLPKFLKDDAALFTGILNDLFPGMEFPVSVHKDLEKSIEECMKIKNLQPLPALVSKVVQLYETMQVRWGIMLVGQAGSGKSAILHTLEEALIKLYNDGFQNPNFRRVNTKTLNPKSIDANELYGCVNPMTLEWKDGLLGLAVRAAVAETNDDYQFIICDGPVDAVWIENLNTTLDDNKMLCLANSERIKLTPHVRMVFEVEDLEQASPATVSRCGMVYIDSSHLTWKALIRSWLNTIDDEVFETELKIYVEELFYKYFDDILNFSKSKCAFIQHQVEISKIDMLCTILKSLLLKIPNMNLMEDCDIKAYICKLWLWSTLWAIGSNSFEASRILLERHIRKLMETQENLDLPESSLWEYRINPNEKIWEKWEVPKFNFDRHLPFYEMIVPTSDTVRFGYVSEILLKENHPVLFMAESGVGKSVLAKEILFKLAKDGSNVPVFINFSAQTNSKRTQEMIENRLEKRKKTLLGAPVGKKVIIFIDDVNMPKPEMYGASPPIELLRQFLDFKGLYDRDKMYWKDIVDLILAAACGPSGGSRNKLSARFMRHFSLLSFPTPNTNTLIGIFGGIIVGFFSEFTKTIWNLAEPVVKAAVTLYERISQELLPTPTKSHYLFNMRDLAKCIQGILQADTTTYNNQIQILRLFYHEALRTFHDRLVTKDDKTYFKNLLNEICKKQFDCNVLDGGSTLLYGDFMVFGQSRENRIYEEIRDFSKLKNILNDYLQDYNSSSGNDLQLILFQDAVEHILRLARILRSERGNALLVGLSGMGKQSLTRLASNINAYQCYQIELKRGYDYSSFRDDLRKCCTIAGINNQPIIFLLNDTQILKEEFLEDINNILNSGDVPNLYEGDEYEKLILNTRVPCIEANYKDQSRDGIYDFFVSRVRSNLHVVICMSPIGEAFRKRLRMFPSLVNCCTIDWFESWPQEALHTVAKGSLSQISDDEYQCENMASICVMIHESVEKASEKYYYETKRHYYATPSSYLELLKQYHVLLKKKVHSITTLRNKIANGLNKILETNEIVAIMENELKIIVPIMEKKSQEMKDTVQKLEKDTAQADSIKKIVQQDEAEAKIKAMETQELADDAAKDLETVMPQLRAAQEALKALNKNDVNEIRVFQKPPKLVQFVMEAVCILLNYKPDWNTAKQMMGDMNFLKRLQEYDANHIPDVIIKKLQPYINHKDFQPAIVEKTSKTARSMCAWVIAMNRYADVYKDVEPKIKKRDAAEYELNQVMQVLKQKQGQLAEAEEKIQSLRDDLDRKQKEMHEIQMKYDLNNKRLTSAGRLTTALSDEEIRWRETVATLDFNLFAIPGDILVASAYIAYLGAFPIDYRKKLCKRWITECQKLKIPCGEDFEFINCLGDPYQLREWNLFGLPRETTSLENGIIATQSSRWPLMIDPQEQANHWIRNMERENNLIITKMSDPQLTRTLEMAITSGIPVLLEEIGEDIDPSIRPVLLRSFYVQGGRTLLRFGENDIEYDPNFRLYLTTKLSNPHYFPEVCIQVTLINFLVSLNGLEDQLLSEVVRIELPEMEKQRNNLIVSINSDKQQLQQLEDRILKLLFSSDGNILDDEELLETLNESKETSMVIASRLIDAEKTEEAITLERERYRPLASKGAVLFFVASTLIEIDPMYQVSLQFFTQIFCSVIEEEAPKMPFEERLKFLLRREIKAIYLNICRGLFERHKLIYSFLLATTIQKHDKYLNDSELDYLLRGDSRVSDATIPEKPHNFYKISEKQWNACIYLQDEFEDFDNLAKDLDKTIEIKLKDQKFILTEGITERSPSINWTEHLSSFKKLLLIAALKPESLMLGISCYIHEILGREFIESRATPLSSVYQDMTPTTPLIFVLSSGSDPMSSLQKFANEKDFGEKLHSISLGQGQGAAAEELFKNCRNSGHWLYLQNCHLSVSWLPKLEMLVRDMMLGNLKMHEDFRLFLSSMPLKSFPVSILQNSVKLTNEPPKGLKANLMRSMMDMNEEIFEIHVLGDDWRKMIFAMCMFHGIILERKKFGSLGFNIQYEFSDNDRECALKTLILYNDREIRKNIPWQALEYINGEITYGGRVTDNWDQRCVRTILKQFSCERILKDDYKYSSSGIYYSPTSNRLEDFKTYVNELPYKEEPEIFGMHENASIVYETKEGNFFLKTILESQAKATSVSENSNDAIVMDVIQKIKNLVKRAILLENFKEEKDDKDRIMPLTTVLMQETERFNKLMKLIHTNLADLERGIKGLILMSENLEAIYDAFLYNQVPRLWSKNGFLSTKSLASWIDDFVLRIDHIQNWINDGQPCSSWISGFFYPQSFLTAVIQTHSRKYSIPIDTLKLDFEVLSTIILQKKINECDLKIPDEGVFVHGLFLEAGKWDERRGGLCDAEIGELTTVLPVLWLKPCVEVETGKRYEAPLYKTQNRAGALSTTGHSTNFIISVFLNSMRPPSFWILRGTALVTLLTE